MDSASQLAGETTKTGDNKISETSLAASPITTSPLTQVSTTTPTTSAAVLLTDKTNEINNTTQAGAQVTTTTSSLSSTSCLSTQNGNGPESNANKKDPSYDKNEESRTVDRNFEFKSQQNEQERLQRVDIEATEQTHSRETENKSPSDSKEGPPLSSSTSSTVSMRESEPIKVDASQSEEGCRTENNYSCSSSNKNNKQHFQPPERDPPASNDRDITMTSMEASSSTTQDYNHEPSKSISAVSLVMPSVKSSDSAEENKSQEKLNDMPVVSSEVSAESNLNVGGGVAAKALEEQPSSSTGSNRESNEIDGKHKSSERSNHTSTGATTKLAETVGLEAIQSASAASKHGNNSYREANNIETNSNLDRCKQYEIGSSKGMNEKKEFCNAAKEAAPTTTFSDKKLCDNNRESVVANMSRKSDLCNYSMAEALTDEKFKQPQGRDCGIKHDVPQGYSHNSQLGPCASSSSNCNQKDTKPSESKNTLAKCNNVVDSSTSCTGLSHSSQAVSTPVIASTKQINLSAYQTNKVAGHLAPRTDFEAVSNLSTGRRNSNPIDCISPSRNTAVAAADSNNYSKESEMKERNFIPQPIVHSTSNKKLEIEAVTSTNYSVLKSSYVDIKRPTYPEEHRNATRRLSEAVDHGAQSNLFTYQTSNQAIVASTIRHLFQKSALEENKDEQRSRVDPFRIQQYGNPNNNQNTVSASHSTLRNSQPPPRDASQYYHHVERAHATQQSLQSQHIVRRQSKELSETHLDTVGSAIVKPFNYSQQMKNNSNAWEKYSQPPSNSIISSSSHNAPPGNRPEMSSSINDKTSSLESIPRIPAMVDTQLAMKKSKSDTERRNTIPQNRERQQQQHHMQPLQSSHHPQEMYGSREIGGGQSSKRNSMYVENPDFSKINHTRVAHHQQKDPTTNFNVHQTSNLSQLHMKPPDFSKIKEAKPKSDAQKYNTPPITPENFAEMSKKYNYVKDLRLKNPPPQEEALHEATAYNNLYMKAPEFSTQKFQTKPPQPSSDNYHSKMDDKRSGNKEPENLLTRRYPQLSDDIVMSVVTSKPANQLPSTASQERKRSEYTVQNNYQSKSHIPHYPNNVHLEPRENFPSSNQQPHIVSADAKQPEQPDYPTSYSQKQHQATSIPSAANSQHRQYYPNSGYPHPQQHPHPQQYVQAQQHAATTSVIQSSRTKEIAIEYPQPTPPERPVTSSNYYQYSHYHQPPSANQTSSSSNKNTSPSSAMMARQYPTQGPIIQQVPSPNNPPSSSSSNKSIPSPGAMNPPYGWPSQSPTPRVGRSPVASPHMPYRISQSPVGTNASSPQSPSFRQPSPKASPSPTHVPRPAPTQPHAPTALSYKNPYMYPPQNETHRGSKEKLQPERQYPEQQMPLHKQEPAPLLPSEYMLHHLSGKANMPRQPDRLDSAYPVTPVTRHVEQPKSAVAYGKPGGSKHQEKPNYREMINNVYAIRNATSEEDLNYQIIQRTLNKDVSIRKSENDLSKSIFDVMPGPTKKIAPPTQLARSNESLNPRVPDPNARYSNNQEYSVPKGYGSNSGPVPSAPPCVGVAKPYVENKVPNLPICNDLARNDISVTVSKVVKPPAERQKSLGAENPSAPSSSYADNKETSTVVISKMKTTPIAEPRNAYASRTRPPEPPPPTVPIAKPPAFSNSAAKRESPLDLSVKTVKTKADSTGCDDSNYSIRNSVTNTLKVDFAPNFSKHVRNMSQPESVPVQQPLSCEPPHRNSYASGTSRQHLPEQQPVPSIQRPPPPMPQQKDVYSTGQISHLHKGNDPSFAQHQSYSYPREQKLYQIIQPPPPNPKENRPTQSNTNYTASALVSKCEQKLANQRPQTTEIVEAEKKVQIPPSAKESQSNKRHDRTQPPPSQHYERINVPQPYPQIAYKDHRYVDAAATKSGELYLANHVAEPEPTRNESYIRRIDIAAKHPPAIQQHGRNQMMARQYSAQEQEQKKAEERKMDSANESRSSYYPNDHTGRKRSLDPSYHDIAAGSQYHSAEKQVRVDELYRAHLAQTQYAHHQHLQLFHQQQQHRQRQEHPVLTPISHSASAPVPIPVPNHYERRDTSASRKDVAHVPAPHYSSQQQYYGTPTPQSSHQNYPVPAPQPLPSREGIQHSNISPSNSRTQQYPSTSTHSDHFHGRPPTAGPQRPALPIHLTQQGQHPLNSAHHGQSHGYQPVQSTYPSQHPVANIHQSMSLSNTPPNTHPRQSPHQSHEITSKSTYYPETAISHNKVSPNLPKYNNQDIHHRHPSDQVQQPQNVHTRSSEYGASHYNSDYYSNSHEKYASQTPQPIASSNSNIHRPASTHEPRKENYLRPEYPNPSSAIHYPPPIIHNREHGAPVHHNQTWFPPSSQAHPEPDKRELNPGILNNQLQTTTSPSAYIGESPGKSTHTRSAAPIPHNSVQANDTQPPKVSPQTQHSHVTNPTSHRGADQNVIDKLRTSIEMRGFEKQKLLNRKQMNGEVQEEEQHKPDIASLLAARIRTKGELKGYTPIPPVEEKKEEEEKPEAKVEKAQEPPMAEMVDTFVDKDNSQSAFDLMDWGSTCNDFVEQLQTGVKKRSAKKRKVQKADSDSSEEVLLEKVEVKENLPGVVYNGDIDPSLVDEIKSEAIEKPMPVAEIKSENKSQQESSSSDEDKPLHLLRQQSLSDVGKVGSDRESIAQTRGVLAQKSEESQEMVEPVTQQSFPSSDSDSEKIIARSVREKQRLKQEKRLAARLGKTSSSEDSDDESRRNLQRPKKLVRKARSRTSGASTTRDSTDSKSDSSNNDEHNRSLFRERLETRKRKLEAENPPLASEIQANNKKAVSNIVVGEDDRKIKLPIAITPSSVVLKREIITKAQIKCMRLPSEKSGSSDEEIAKKEVEYKAQKLDEQKANSEDDFTASQDSSNLAATKLKMNSKKSKRPESPKIEETMTRSKRKKELEEQLANSKVLRNDKVIQNTPIKSKPKSIEKTPVKITRGIEQKSSEEKPKSQISTRSSKTDKAEESKRKLCGNESDDKPRKKISKSAKDESSLSSGESGSDTEPKTVSERLLLRRSRLSNESTPVEKSTEPRKTRSSDRSKTEADKKSPVVPKTLTPNKKQQSPSNKQKSPSAETNTDKFPPGWELEVYQFKRALKIPQRLITIKGPAHHRVSTSLPDLDPHSSDASESFSVDNLRLNSKQAEKNDKENKDTRVASQKRKSLKGNSMGDDTFNDVPESQEAKSIIDILHQRVPFSRRFKEKKINRSLGRNEARMLPAGTNQTALLPTPKTTNIFRGENHHIREIFGAEDRPASAPPELTDSKDETEPRMTFAKKYEEYLAAMNDVDFGSRLRKNKKVSGEVSVEETSRCSVLDVPIKKEKIDEFVMQQDDEETQDTEINACLSNAVELKSEPADNNERDTPSIISEHGDGITTPILFKRKKNNKIRSNRRKGSSGFDYIRKKKKPTPNPVNGQETAKKKRVSPVELLNTRDENDISREIQKWVLNKGVGQSALHKAARLGYIDVIAYCLERMGLNPDPKDNAGYTPLHEACSKGRIDIARLLLEYGANHSEVAASGIRPLHEASENGYIEIVRLLLSYGADPLVTTYSGQTPLMLAEGSEMEHFIKNHLQDVQNTGPHKQPWKLLGPWYIYDPDTCGFDVLAGAPDESDDFDDMDDSQISKNTLQSEIIKSEDMNALQDPKSKCDTNSNSIVATYEERNRQLGERTSFKNKLKVNCAVVLNNIESIEHISTVKQFKDYQSRSIQRRRSTNESHDDRSELGEETDGDGEAFEFEESHIPLPPLYLLKDEGAEKWVMLSDLCSLLKVKSKDTLLKQISPSLPPPTNKELLRELKMSDFLEKATCLQLLCAGEKINVRSSKVVLVKYNESVQNLLGVKTIVMKF